MKNAMHACEPEDRGSRILSWRAMWVMGPLFLLLALPLATTLSRGQDAARFARDAPPALDPAMAAAPGPQDSSPFLRLERQSAQLARHYRQFKQADAAEQADGVRKQLAQVVEKAFDARQEMQQKEIDELRKRLAEVEAILTTRQEHRAEIIENRIAELLNEDVAMRWDPSARPTAPAAGIMEPGPMLPGAPRTAPAVPRDATAPPSVPSPAGLPAAPPAPAGVPRARTGPRPPGDSAAPPAAGNPLEAPLPNLKPDTAPSAGKRFPTLPPASPSDASQPAGGGTTLPTLQTLSDGQLFSTRRAMIDTVVDLERAETTFQRLSSLGNAVAAEQLTEARFNLEKARRHAELARAEYESQLQMLQLELDDAQRHLHLCSRDRDRAKTLYDAKAMARNEWERIEAEAQRAAAHVERLALLLDLHRKAGPDESSASPPSNKS